MNHQGNEIYTDKKDLTNFDNEKILNMLGTNIAGDDNYNEVLSLLNQMYQNEDVQKIVKVTKEEPAKEEIKKDFDYYSLQGNSYLKNKDYISALNSYKAAFKQKTNDVNLIMKIAYCYQKTKKPKNA
ncbi:MAG: hypothetical protein EOO96_09620, partial [Pedobacter sp.]